MWKNFILPQFSGPPAAIKCLVFRDFFWLYTVKMAEKDCHYDFQKKCKLQQSQMLKRVNGFPVALYQKGHGFDSSKHTYSVLYTFQSTVNGFGLQRLPKA